MSDFTCIFKDSLISLVNTFEKYLSKESLSQILKEILDDLSSTKQRDDENIITCQGCLENQPNQQAHMDFGGCLYLDEE